MNKKALRAFLDEIGILFVLVKGEPDDKVLTRDGKIRCDAVIEIMHGQDSALKETIFVGGNPEEGGGKAVAQQMKDFFDRLTNRSDISRAVFKSNNAFGNVREIIDIAEQKELSEVYILANRYQLPRFVKIFKKLKFDSAEVVQVPAEDVLMLDVHKEKEMRAYLKSFKYWARILLEKLLIVWMIFDPEYRLITKWRKLRRSRLSRVG